MPGEIPGPTPAEDLFSLRVIEHRQKAALADFNTFELLSGERQMVNETEQIIGLMEAHGASERVYTDLAWIHTLQQCGVSFDLLNTIWDLKDEIAQELNAANEDGNVLR